MCSTELRKYLLYKENDDYDSLIKPGMMENKLRDDLCLK